MQNPYINTLKILQSGLLLDGHRIHIPAIVSTVLCLPYCVMAISAGQEQYSNVENVLLGVLSLVICIANLCLMQIVTPRIYKWIKNKM